MRGMRVRVPAGLLILLLSVGSVSAQPTAPIRNFMKEPTSLFDLGMDKLERKLQGSDISKTFLVSPFYDWEKNKIIIYFAHKNGTTRKELEQAIIICRKGIIYIKKLLISESGGLKFNLLDQMFGHKWNEKIPDRQDRNISNITQINGFIRLKNRDTEMKCTASILGKTVTLTEQKENEYDLLLSEDLR